MLQVHGLVRFSPHPAYLADTAATDSEGLWCSWCHSKARPHQLPHSVSRTALINTAPPLVSRLRAYSNKGAGKIGTLPYVFHLYRNKERCAQLSYSDTECDSKSLRRTLLLAAGRDSWLVAPRAAGSPSSSPPGPSRWWCSPPPFPYNPQP